MSNPYLCILCKRRHVRKKYWDSGIRKCSICDYEDQRKNRKIIDQLHHRRYASGNKYGKEFIRKYCSQYSVAQIAQHLKWKHKRVRRVAKGMGIYFRVGKTRTGFRSISVHQDETIYHKCWGCRKPFFSDSKKHYCKKCRKLKKERIEKWDRINKKKIEKSIAIGGYGIGNSDEQAGGGEYKIK